MKMNNNHSVATATEADDENGGLNLGESNMNRAPLVGISSQNQEQLCYP